MQTFARWYVVAVTLGAAAAASAQNPMGLSGQAAFGYLATSGNSENENLNLAFSGKYDKERWHHELAGLAVRASTASVTTAGAYGLGWKSSFDLSDKNYLFGLAAWDKDEFSAYERQVREVFGYGRRFIETERHVLRGEAGLGFRQATLRNGTSQDDSIGRLGVNYEWIASETAKFSQVLSVESGSDNTYTASVSSLHADIVNNFAIVLSYTLKTNSSVPVGIKKRDTFTAVSIEYSF